MRVTIKPDSASAPEWVHVFGAEPVPVRNDYKQIDGEACFSIDPRTMTVRQLGALVQHLSRKWKQPADKVSEQILRHRAVLVKVAEVVIVPENDVLF